MEYTGLYPKAPEESCAPFLSELKAHDNLYLGVSERGGLRFRRNVRIHHDRWMSKASVVAIALTDLCAEFGIGKVYLYTECADETLAPEHVLRRLLSLPQFLYVPEVWEHDAVDKWFALRPSERLGRVTAASGWLPAHHPVMPICLDDESEEELDYLFLSGFTQAPVTIALMPQAYVGYTKKMRREGETVGREIVPGRFVAQPNPLRWSNQRMSEFRVSRGVDVIKRLHELYFDEQNDVQVRFSMQAIHDAYASIRIAVREEHAGGRVNEQ